MTSVADAADDPLVAADAAAGVLAERTGVASHDVALVCGSGWVPAADRLGAAETTMAAGELPGFPAPSVEGHGAEIRSLSVGGRRVLVLLGRVHAYEGHPLSTVVHPVRTAVAAGCRVVVLTNAAGGIDPALAVGEPVLIADQINLTGRSPLTGPALSRGPRFVDCTDLFSARLRGLARELDADLAESVYVGVNGPQYETPAEIEFFRRIGGGLVGMSTVHESVAAHQMGAEILGVSLVTNPAAGTAAGDLDHADVLDVAAAAATRIGDLLSELVPRL